MLSQTRYVRTIGIHGINVDIGHDITTGEENFFAIGRPGGMLFKFSGIGQLPRLATTCIDGVQIPVADVFLRRSIEDRALALKRRIGFCGNLENRLVVLHTGHRWRI